MRKVFIVAPILFSFCLSCTVSNKMNLAGKYECKSSKFYSSVVILNKDNTFEYNYQAGDLYKSNVKGTWDLSKDRKYLILSSYLHSDNDLIKVTENENDNLSQVKICIYNMNNSPYFGYAKINPIHSDDSVKFTPVDYVNVCKYYPKNKVHEIAITYLGLKGKILFYKTKNGDANEFFIHVSMKDHYRFFVSERWNIKKNKLVDLDTAYNRGGKSVSSPENSTF